MASRSPAPRRGLAAALLVATAISPAAAAFIGDPAAAPEVRITESPPACCPGIWAGTLRGTLANIDPDAVAVAIYSHTDVWYLQPFETSLILPDAAGRFATSLRGGDHYAALVVPRHPAPAPVVAALPEVDGHAVRARCVVPESQRRIVFAGRSWVVKSSPHLAAGPGPNLWSDGPESVWVDAVGLHLRIVQRDGQWYGAEVFSDDYCGYARYRFEVESNVANLDPRAVFAGFLYDDNGSEMDIEWSRWGDATNATNAQFVVHPDQVQPLALALDAAPIAHELNWTPGSAAFAAHRIDAGATATLAAWSVHAGVPSPEFTRWRFNLWLQNGLPPAGLEEIEVVVRGFDVATPTDVAGLESPPSHRLAVASPRRAGLFSYRLDMPASGRVAVTLFDARGRRVASLLDRFLPAGTHAMTWDSRAVTSAGTYFLQASGTGIDASRKVVLVP